MCIQNSSRNIINVLKTKYTSDQNIIYERQSNKQYKKRKEKTTPRSSV